MTKPKKLYLSYLNKVADKTSLLSSLYFNRVTAQDFKGALKYLEEMSAI